MNINFKKLRAILVLIVTFATFSDAVAQRFRWGQPVRRVRQRLQNFRQNVGNFNQRHTGNRLGLTYGQPVRNIARCVAGAALILADGTLRVVEGGLNFAQHVTERAVQFAGRVVVGAANLARNAVIGLGVLTCRAGQLVRDTVVAVLEGGRALLRSGAIIALNLATAAVNGASYIATGRPLIQNYNNGHYAYNNQNQSSRQFCHKCGKYHSYSNNNQYYSNNQGYTNQQYQYSQPVINNQYQMQVIGQ